MVKNLSAMQETRVQSLGHEDPLEKGVSTHSSILAWRIHGQRKLVGCSPWKSWKCSLLSRVWLFAIPPTEACQVPLSMGILWARILEWIGISFSRGSSQTRDQGSFLNYGVLRVAGFDPWVGKVPWRRKRLPTPVFWPGEFHGLYSSWGRKVLDMTERFHYIYKSFTDIIKCIRYSIWGNSKKSETTWMYFQMKMSK